ncbi:MULTISPECIES: hypothetical protein [unclassified Polaromonas]|jgi:hypothetical protein|uniref:hypothetical protein n=1 Tax=unclassified Polaromonas TaxID=2638319 RepID=UPI000BD12484|nr:MULTISPECIES: hypothetical protein [unclassified Polaromonas]OYY34785.1 MAG: hypothetical protein B7Y60_15210 [Polaromonas sp. 35-63-35]OYZ19328.1 MAG: hypothetical protein B7Y28_12380 [Polaromonas sp. 16-63-31]OZA48471.1 MAG: hypothetical protein B7X88_18150 [Polaromonas sp. 17-63-33]OZA87219.1 MAG: hypothetical protein B7X65_13620 [Polaromonas sp. 39-63-25]HQR98159.1 hypothetical protein [Polaromonas sp.]
MNPIVGFAPDADKMAPGIFTDCSNVIPYEAGFKGAPTPVAVAVTALAAECRGAVVATQLDGIRRIFAGTQTKLYELVSSAWTDVSAVGSYTGSSETRWSFCQFGNTTIASNLIDAMQSSASGNFAAVPTAPKAKIVVSASNNFVVAFNTNDATYSASPDRWWCCAQGDQTNWTPSVTTSATTGRLVAVEGAIEAAMTLGNDIVAYKRRAMFVGRFAAAPVVWEWTLIPAGEAGAVGQEAVCDIGGAHFFVSDDNFWLFDGTRPIPIGDGEVRQWFLNNSSPTYRYRTKAIYEKQNNLVRVFYPSLSSTGACDATLVYHVLKKQWGRHDLTIQAPLNYIAPGATIDGLDAYSATIDGLPDVPFDSQFWLAGGRQAAYFNTSHQLVSLTGATGPSSFTTGDMGDDDAVTVIDRFRVRFESSPTTATATGYYKFNEGDALATGPSSTINDGKFDIRQSGRFHRVKVEMTGDHKEYAYAGKPKVVGGR